MAKVVMIGPNLRTSDGSVHHVHAAGCADIQRSPLYKSPEYDNDKKYVLDLATVKEVTHHLYPPGDFEYDGDAEWKDFAMDIKVFPCVGEMPEE